MTTRTAEISPRIEIPFIVKHIRVAAFLMGGWCSSRVSFPDL